ncbi:MOSC domain-containing protein [Janibacter sp. YB324]|uniref:MOSC domain-containing protein n=1 Tax=Janibacter sp. YB324 TaxID=2761047 RepID=UPI001CB89F84|nr:MOSC domain-containing protein [Janibacter sp. YB324]
MTTGALRELGEVQDARFRATLTIAADRDPEPGSLLRLGEAVVRVRGAVPRCRVVDINTETGELDTRHLHTLARRDRPEGEVPFGIDADVVTPGVVRREDPVALI